VPAASLSDHVYRTLQLFVFESGDLSGAIPWQLEVTRVFAPLLAAYSAVRSVLALSRHRLDVLRAARATGHVIVCGLGDSGTLVVEDVRRAGHAVVAVEHDHAAAGIDRARRCGAAVVVGDATDPQVLERAGVRRAAHLISLCHRGDVDAEVALAARRSSRGRIGTLSCRLEIDEPVLADLLELLELAEHYEPGFRLDFLDVWGAAARAMVRRFPPAGGPRAPHVVVVGLGRFGGSVVAEVARRHHDHDPDGELMDVTVVDTRGQVAVDALVARLPHLRTVCRFSVCTDDLAGPQGADAIKGLLSGADPPGAVYVCVPDEGRGLAIALQSRSWLPADSGVVVVRMRRHGGLAEALEQLVGEQAGIHAFPVLDAALTADVVLGGRIEQIARALHEEYRRDHPGSPADVDWEALPDDLRESNRDHARHAGVKLRAAQCHLAPLRSWDASAFVFRIDEVERLAQMEHERWLAERRAAGWTAGPRRGAATTSPSLVPWAELTEDVREIDRALVRALPRVLAAAGYEIRRDELAERGAPHGP
jgi:voltage-gated potassium channel Kch